MGSKAWGQRLTPLAEAALKDIWLYVFRQWSPEQADAYVCGIVAASSHWRREIMDCPQHVPLLQCLASGRIHMPVCSVTLRKVILRGGHCDAGSCMTPVKGLLYHRHPCNTSRSRIVMNRSSSWLSKASRASAPQGRGGEGGRIRFIVAQNDRRSVAYFRSGGRRVNEGAMAAV
ncbi:type II toxin-antitoxin system RelE/ParE family toxin [uncultured Desulfovibrio sp.]|uniref:type II toxin-antitoxin system RelE/ParE family toxin n=1 Tax=uncultured Desulfovibrio sp. TaxID=167968 RepID=UPI002633BADA|nr:type II toxin-antitoxin system RelE/ParE family toxin [uncultured Desulfovibrio sp.]